MISGKDWMVLITKSQHEDRGKVLVLDQRQREHTMTNSTCLKSTDQCELAELTYEIKSGEIHQARDFHETVRST
ncbi:unnamed protein product [Haemonchus placei]|uniref:Uncharacterized protein n=1 Tax=Haemonchus placei TaxID=6290 RepID=A0A0N4X2K2_HAEPC|nr:unnamed protein product [Haemonchus placei]